MELQTSVSQTRMFVRDNRLSTVEVVTYVFLFYFLSVTSILAATGVSVGYKCEYSITYKAEAFHISKHHSNHTSNALMFAAAAATLISLLSSVCVAFVMLHGAREYTSRGYTAYRRDHALSLGLSVLLCVILSIITGITIGTEV